VNVFDASALLASYDLHLEPVSTDDAEQAAATWASGSGLSLGDRLCLTLGQRLEATGGTMDRNWGGGESIRQIR
jgi:ribonuclease VapC